MLTIVIAIEVIISKRFLRGLRTASGCGSGRSQGMGEVPERLTCPQKLEKLLGTFHILSTFPGIKPVRLFKGCTVFASAADGIPV